MLCTRSLISHCQRAQGVPAVSALPPPPLVCEPEHQAVIAVAGLQKDIAEHTLAPQRGRSRCSCTSASIDMLTPRQPSILSPHASVGALLPAAMSLDAPRQVIRTSWKLLRQVQAAHLDLSYSPSRSQDMHTDLPCTVSCTI